MDDIRDFLIDKIKEKHLVDYIFELKEQMEKVSLIENKKMQYHQIKLFGKHLDETFLSSNFSANHELRNYIMGSDKYQQLSQTDKNKLNRPMMKIANVMINKYRAIENKNYSSFKEYINHPEELSMIYYNFGDILGYGK